MQVLQQEKSLGFSLQAQPHNNPTFNIDTLLTIATIHPRHPDRTHFPGRFLNKVIFLYKRITNTNTNYFI